MVRMCIPKPHQRFRNLQQICYNKGVCTTKVHTPLLAILVRKLPYTTRFMDSYLNWHLLMRDYLPKLSMISTISAPMRFWASLVAAPIWGVQDTMGWLYRALLVAGSSA